MSVDELFQDLLSAVALTGEHAVLRVNATYQPSGGQGSKVFPPTYPARDGVPPYVLESRMVDGEERRDVLLDSVPSQANRAEEALLRARRAGLVAFPMLELRHTGDAEVVLTSLEFPHRYADAYLRDSLIDGTKFDKSDVGTTMLSASTVDATGLLLHDPGSLVFGAWNSHRKGRQQKFPRVYSSEVVGWDPVEGRRNAGRMDPLNLVGAAKPGKDGDEWEYAPVGQKTKGERLSEIGHGNIAPNPQHGGVTVSSASRMAMLSLAGLDRLGFGSVPADTAVAARTVLAAYALLADRLAFGGPALWLRSGCELVMVEERVEWVDRGGNTEEVAISASTAVEVFRLAVAHAAEVGLVLPTDTVVLTPSPSLAKAIDFSLTKAESAGE
jgi:CRISPR-associated protein Csb1